MTARDPAAVVAANAGALKREETKREAGERLLGRDAATLLAPDVKNASGDPAATAEALFRAGQKAAGDLSGTVSRAAFVRTLIEKAKIAESDLFPVLASGEPVRVIYARAGAADRAYRLISALFSDLRVGYAETNQDAAEGVESGDADLLLLPYADAAGNPVLSTEALSENAGKLVYSYAGGTADVEGTTDPSEIDAEASIAKGAHIIYSETNDTSKDFHQRKVASLKK